MDSEPRPPLISGKYEILHLAGEGGMAAVWKAMSHGAAKFSRPVAIKRIRPEMLQSSEFVAMFVEEARVGSQLIHANIVQIYDFDRDDAGFFLVMEWVDGLDLRSYLRSFSGQGQRAPWPLLVAIAVESLRGLSAAHERVDLLGQRAPVIHRDVTPQNILLGANGNVKLTDFGLARAMDRARSTDPSIIKGKLAYLAPELTLGQPASPQSDIFSLGVVLWEALAGRQLHEGETDVEIFLSAKNFGVPPLAPLRKDLPRDLLKVISRVLDREPQKRYRSARELLRALTRILRKVSDSTDSYALSQSVIEASCCLGRPPEGIMIPPGATVSRPPGRKGPPPLPRR